MFTANIWLFSLSNFRGFGCQL